eukprot:scaffold1291_cov412-Prasinococcus_capsulatus_cf.AAC.12
MRELSAAKASSIRTRLSTPTAPGACCASTPPCQWIACLWARTHRARSTPPAELPTARARGA